MATMITNLRTYIFPKSGSKLGTIKGVFLPNILQMIGVILFMRLGWVLGHVGMFNMSMIITLSSSLLFVTALSLTAIISNMKVEGGGAYYLISRILGIEFGSAIGILITIAQHASIALCVSGFSVSLKEFFPHIPITFLEVGTLCLLAFVSYTSTSLAVKMQLIIAAILFTSIGSVFFGMKPDYNLPTTTTPAIEMGFWLAFSMFFPATTGIEAGMSMSGDLKNPKRSLPVGTIASVITAYFLYLNLAIFLSRNVSSELLTAYPMILYYVSKMGMLVILGIWGATLSSALGSIMGAPRIIQAIASDGIFPSFLAKGHGPLNQPRIATLMVFCTSMVLTIFTNINQIIPIMSMICLVLYGLINFVAFFEEFIKNPSWRPTFKVPWYISLCGSLSCFIVMVMINPGATCIVIALVILLCIWTSRRKVNGNWDDIRFSLYSYLVNRGAKRLAAMKPNAKSWRPNIITFFSPNQLYPNLINFSNILDQGKGFLTFATQLGEKEAYSEILRSHHVDGYVHIGREQETIHALQQTIHDYGLGPLRPNTVIFSLHSPILKEVQMTNILKQKNKNLIFLNDDSNNLRLYRENALTPKKINLWWRGDYQKNFEFCLALSHIMQSSPAFADATIRIQSIIPSEEKEKQLTAIYDRAQKRMRLRNLLFKPIIDPDVHFFANFEKASADADFTYIGLRHQQEGESDDAYEGYINNLIQGTAQVENIAYVLAGEEMNFTKIFT
ncbi:MAG: amino acid permease [Simkaniaceae bacterium]|nr:amino acid permease [Simkaniaceae bacterium]